MASFARSLNFELSPDLHFDKYAQQILENSKAIVAAVAPAAAAAANIESASASTPTITTLNATSSGELLQKIGASILNSIQLQKFLKYESGAGAGTAQKMDEGFAPHHVVIDSSSFDTMDELQKQVEYDKFMNEVWIGIVMTLVLISLVFCICSCFLYHQFRTWKRNYRSTVAQSRTNTANDVIKLPTDFEDPVPEYTLVSGLPSYEAALELLHKTPQSRCLIVYPSVFSVFNKNEKTACDELPAYASPQPQQVTEVTTPLLSTASATTMSSANVASTTQNASVKSYSDTVPSYAEAVNMSAVTLTCVNEKATPKQAKNSTTTTVVSDTIVTPTASIAAADIVYVKTPTYEEALLHKNS